MTRHRQKCPMHRNQTLAFLICVCVCVSERAWAWGSTGGGSQSPGQWALEGCRGWESGEASGPFSLFLYVLILKIIPNRKARHYWIFGKYWQVFQNGEKITRKLSNHGGPPPLKSPFLTEGWVGQWHQNSSGWGAGASLEMEISRPHLKPPMQSVWRWGAGVRTDSMLPKWLWGVLMFENSWVSFFFFFFKWLSPWHQ